MAYEFKLTRHVDFAETDMAGIMHFSNFFRFMEATETAFFRSLSLSIFPENPTRQLAGQECMLTAISDIRYGLRTWSRFISSCVKRERNPSLTLSSSAS